MYDIIGDVHGYAALLKRLLKKLGYKKNNGSYSHLTNKAIFVGDFINRGPEVRETVQIIRSMVEAGNAYAILGNHELNALIYYLKDENKVSLGLKNISGFFKTRRDFRYYPEEWKSHRKWMRSLPLFMELDSIRIVHGCWMDDNIRYLKNEITEGILKKKILRQIYLQPDSPAGKSVWQTTKGLYLTLPPDLSIRNNKKASVRSFRMKWWEPTEGKTFSDISFESKMVLPRYTVPPEILPTFVPYPADAPLVFFGHYCRGNGPFVIKDNICCVDSCVTGTGTLSAYTWQGENKLLETNMVYLNMKNIL